MAKEQSETLREPLVVDLSHLHTTKACFASYLGPWLVDATWLQSAIGLVQGGYLAEGRTPAPEAKAHGERDTRLPFPVTKQGVAIIHIEGPMMKGESKFGGTSTMNVRRELGMARRDERVAGVLLVIDSPGGTLAGTDELAQDVRVTADSMPVHAHIQDFGASAALWVAVQADRVTANRMAEVGSIGVLAVIDDSSVAAGMEGITVHVISSGPFKGLGVPGTPVTESHLSSIQADVDAVAKLFFQTVQQRRGLSDEQMAAVSDGKIYMAPEALMLGLIDEVSSVEDALEAVTARSADAFEGRRKEGDQRFRTTSLR